MRLQELKLIVTASSEEASPAPVSLQAVSPLVMARLFTALERFAKDIGDDATVANVRLFEGSAGIGYAPSPAAQYVFPEVEIQGQRYTAGAFDPSDPYLRLIGGINDAARLGKVDIGVLGGNQLLRITPSKPATLPVKEDIWVTTELSLYGEIRSVGGKDPNIHLVVDGSGERLTIEVTKAQAQGLTVYGRYYIRAEAEVSVYDSAMRGPMRMLAYEEEMSADNNISHAEYIRREQPNWQDIGDPVEWVRQRRRSQDEEAR